MKIVFVGNNGSRSAAAIIQGFIANNCDVFLDKNHYSFGKLIKASDKNLFKRLSNNEFDLIIAFDLLDNKTIILFDKLALWNKVVHIDYRDSCKLTNYAKKAFMIFKRSVVCGPDRINPNYDTKVYSLPHSAMNEYYLPHSEPIFYDVSCLFDLTNPNMGQRRTNLVKTLKRHEGPNWVIGKSTGYGASARSAVMNLSESNNFFIDYLKIMSSSKIVFTAQPTHCDGDNRTWEAFCSKALVFMDVTKLTIDPPIIDGIHCIMFDASDSKSILKAIDKAKYYLVNESERLMIANAGYDFVKNNHKGYHRVKYILDYFSKKNKLVHLL